MYNEMTKRMQDGGEPSLRSPDLDTLMEREAEAGCEAACPEGCWVVPDGYCLHGKPSWLIVMGLI